MGQGARPGAGNEARPMGCVRPCLSVWTYGVCEVPAPEHRVIVFHKREAGTPAPLGPDPRSQGRTVQGESHHAVASGNKGTVLGGEISGLPVRKGGERPASGGLGCQQGAKPPFQEQPGRREPPPAAHGAQQWTQAADVCHSEAPM